MYDESIEPITELSQLPLLFSDRYNRIGIIMKILNLNSTTRLHSFQQARGLYLPLKKEAAHC